MKRRIRRGGALLLPMHGDVLLLQEETDADDGRYDEQGG